MKDYKQWLLGVLVLVAVVSCYFAGKGAGYDQGYRVGHVQGVSADRKLLRDKNTIPINNAIRDAFVRGCTLIIADVAVQVGKNYSDIQAQAEQTCHDEIMVPYYMLRTQ